MQRECQREPRGGTPLIPSGCGRGAAPGGLPAWNVGMALCPGAVAERGTRAAMTGRLAPWRQTAAAFWSIHERDDG